MKKITLSLAFIMSILSNLSAQTEIGDSKSSLLAELGDKIFEKKITAAGDLFITKNNLEYERFLVMYDNVITITKGYFKNNPESLKLYHETEQTIKKNAKLSGKDIWQVKNSKGNIVNIEFQNEGNEYRIFFSGN